MENAILKSKIEAILFITSKAMQPDEIAQLLNIEEEQAQEALLDLMFDYASRDGALEIDDEDGYIKRLSHLKERCSTLTNLSHAARRRLHKVGRHGLY